MRLIYVDSTRRSILVGGCTRRDRDLVVDSPGTINIAHELAAADGDLRREVHLADCCVTPTAV